MRRTPRIKYLRFEVKMGKQFTVQINKKQTLAVIETEGEVTVLSEDIVSNRSLQYSYGNKTITLSNGGPSLDWKVCIDPYIIRC